GGVLDRSARPPALLPRADRPRPRPGPEGGRAGARDPRSRRARPQRRRARAGARGAAEGPCEPRAQLEPLRKRMNMKRAIIWIVAILALSGIAYAGYRIIGGSKKVAPKFTTVTAEKGPIVAKVTASGTLSAVTTVQVGSQVSGRIDQIMTDFNG